MKKGEATLRHLLAPIQGLLDDTKITEVVVNRPGEVGIEARGQWTWLDVPAFTTMHLDAIGILAAGITGKRFDPANPIAMTSLPDGQRLTLVRNPVLPNDVISLTIRIPSQDKHYIKDDDFEGLMEKADFAGLSHNPVDDELLRLYNAKSWSAFFSLAVKARKTIAATGETGSGKTSFLKRMMQDISETERVITVEDTYEFNFDVRNKVAMLFGAPGITCAHLINATLRMRPDRVAVQEIRSGEDAFPFLRSLAAGSKGFTSWHANDGNWYSPLATMIRENPAGQTIPEPVLHKMLHSFLDVIVYCHRNPITNKYSVPSVWFRGAEQ